MTDTPHFDYPFRRNTNGSAAEIEQDSSDDITNAAMAVLKTPVGYRLELPDFGIRETALHEGGPELHEILTALSNWEPRASYELSADKIADLAQHITINVSGIESA